MLKHLKIIVIFISILMINDSFAQDSMISNDLVNADFKVDSIFRLGFQIIDNYDFSLKVKDPGFSMTDFSEPNDIDVFVFVDLLINTSNIQCDSILSQPDWIHDYCFWDKQKIDDWKKWYIDNAKNLNWSLISKSYNEIKDNWITR